MGTRTIWGAPHGAKHTGTNSSITHSRARKRAYKRACARAREQGGTWYRGVWRNARSLGVLPAEQRPQQPDDARRRQPTLQGRCPRLRVLTYNVGGLTAELYNILVTWLHEQRVADVVVLQETHWGLGKQDGQWSIGSWHFLTSADPQARYAGVCICISDKLASRDDISYSTWVPGRVLHARLTGHTVPIDIVAVYQWVMQDRQPEQAKRNRSRLWAQLTANAWAATWARVSSQGSAPRTLNWRDFYRRLISVWSTRGDARGLRGVPLS